MEQVKIDDHLAFKFSYMIYLFVFDTVLLTIEAQVIQTESQKGCFHSEITVQAKISISWTLQKRCLDAEV